jgi:hypothetical protein
MRSPPPNWFSRNVPMTRMQEVHIDKLAEEFGLTPGVLDWHSRKRFGKARADLSITQAHKLIGMMRSWKELPPEFQRALKREERGAL